VQHAVMATNPENAYRNGTLYSSYTASSLQEYMTLLHAIK
jgi:hypothetical protein